MHLFTKHLVRDKGRTGVCVLAGTKDPKTLAFVSHLVRALSRPVQNPMFSKHEI